MWPDAQLRAKLLHDIRKDSMRHGEWTYTRLEAVHETLSGMLTLVAGEAVIVSEYLSSAARYVMTTRWV